MVSISPNTGPLPPGSLVQITGTGFIGASSVTIGGVSCPIFFLGLSDSSVFCFPPAGPPGPQDVTVPSPTGIDTLVGGFTYSGVQLTGISPGGSLPAGGGTLTITGAGLAGTAR